MEPGQERIGQVAADRVVADEVAVGGGCRLADVVDKRRQADDGLARRHGVDGPHGVVPQVLAGDLGLGDAALVGQLDRDLAEQAGGLQQAQADRRPVGGQELGQLARDPLAREVPDELGLAADRGERAGPIVKSSWAARRTARIIRRASSPKRSAGTPTATRRRRRGRPGRRTGRPGWGWRPAARPRPGH